MVEPTKRLFSDREEKEFLEKMAVWRSKCADICTKAPVYGNAYNAASDIMRGIDHAAEELTGDRSYFRSAG